METLSKENINSFLENLAPSTIALNSESASKLAASIELPTTRNEKWKYTRLGKIKRGSYVSPASNEVENLDSYKFVDCPTAVFINGVYQSSLSTISEADVEITPYSENNKLVDEDIDENDPFQAINVAYLTGGLDITVKKSTVMSAPIHILNITTQDNINANLRITINSEENSQGTFILSNFGSSSGAFTNLYLKANLAQNAHLNIDKLQYDSEENYTISNELIHQHRDSVFTINTFTLNGALVRNNLNISVDGENCETNLYGAYILKGSQHVDNHTVVDQMKPNCESNELYKGVMDDKSTGVFNGKVFVRKDAQKVNAFQSNGNVLLSDDANVNSKPELEIYADDVKCSHGSTTGQLDEEAVFYLRSRGISENSARQLLVTAFIEDTFEHVKNEEIVEFIHGLIKDRFGWQI